jgi:hypothetical protein
MRKSCPRPGVGCGNFDAFTTSIREPSIDSGTCRHIIMTIAKRCRGRTNEAASYDTQWVSDGEQSLSWWWSFIMTTIDNIRVRTYCEGMSQRINRIKSKMRDSPRQTGLQIRYLRAFDRCRHMQAQHGDCQALSKTENEAESCDAAPDGEQRQSRWSFIMTQ